MDTTTALRFDLFSSYEALLQKLVSFSAALRNDHALPLWVSRTEQELADQKDMRQKAIQLYQQLWYLDAQEGRETITCPGLIGVSGDTLNAALACNEAKDVFKSAVLALKALGKNQADILLSDLQTREPEVSLALRRMGTARLNLKQAYRHIPLLKIKPVKVGFTWSKQGRTIQRISVAEARRLLSKRQSTPLIQGALSKLASLSENEILARARSVVPHLRANIVFDPNTVTPHRRLIQTPLPLLVPLLPGENLPEFVPIPPEPIGQDRLKRSDVKIDDTPFIPMLGIYRYKEMYRA